MSYRVLGIDENGLGPQLGPLVATAVMIEVEGKGEDYTRDAWRQYELGRELGISDSKISSGFGHMARAERLSLALAEQLSVKKRANRNEIDKVVLRDECAPRTAEELQRILSLDSVEKLQSICPNKSSHGQCWSQTVPLPAFEGQLEHGRSTLQALANQGIRIQ